MAELLCRCGKPALTQVGDKGFCKAHRPEAVTASIRLGSKKMGTSTFATTISREYSVKGGRAKARACR